MKNYLSLIKPFLLFTLLFPSFSSFAQRGTVPAVYRADYNRMMNNQTMSLAMQNARFAQYNQLSVNNEDPYTFRVFFKDSTKMFVNSFIYSDSVKHSFYIVAVDKSLPETDPNREQKIYPDQTSSIIQFNDNGNLSGVPTDSCWLFKVISGKINIYSKIPKNKGLKNEMITAAQIGTGPIDRFFPLVLYPVIKEDKAALNEWDKYSFINAIKRYNKDNK
jgi:hypothetical protein